MDLFVEFPSIHLRHDEIGDNDWDRIGLLLDLTEALFSIFGEEDGMTPLL
ncbi:MAG: hypothetical protein MPW15_19035 [Candidatus Manganitrophus sp.]|nr:hypothetical protein [Candidatus Manganitrophus sp.]